MASSGMAQAASEITEAPEQRAWAKYLTVQEWFDARARGYKDDPSVRRSAAERLYAALDKSLPDPRQTYWNN